LKKALSKTPKTGKSTKAKTASREEAGREDTINPRSGNDQPFAEGSTIRFKNGSLRKAAEEGEMIQKDRCSS